MSGSSPQVSVIIATRNDANRVGLAIVSVLEQSLQDFEIIVINDGSSDDTAAVLERYKRHDPRISVLTNSTCLGRAEARNVGMRQAQADLLAILDSDDIMLPSRLSEQVQFMLQSPAVGVLGSGMVLDLDGQLLYQQPLGDDATIRRKLHVGENTVTNASCMFRRSLILSSGGYRSSKYSPIYNEDYYTLIGLLPKTQFAILPQPLIVVCAEGLTHPNKIKAKLQEKMRLERHLFWRDRSVARLIRTTMGTVLSLLPATFIGAFYVRRLMRWHKYQSPESIQAWKQHLDQKRQAIETRRKM